MVILNDFLKNNIVTVTKFLSEINVCLRAYRCSVHD